MKMLETTFKIKATDVLGGDPSGIFMEFPYEPTKTAEYFRQYVLLPALNVYEKLEIDLGESDYSASWLIEAFAGLINYGIITLDEFKRKVFIICSGHFYSVQVNQYVAQAVYNSKVYVDRTEIKPALTYVSTSQIKDKETLVLVYENFEIQDPRLNILCLELCGPIRSIRTLVDTNDVLVNHLTTSLKSIFSLQNPDFNSFMSISGITYNIFGCDRDDLENELNEISVNTDHKVRVLRRLMRTPELTVFDVGQ